MSFTPGRKKSMLLGRLDVYCKSKFKDMLILNHADIHHPQRVNLEM